MNAALKMKRDYELIRKILLKVEENNGKVLEYKTDKSPQEAYHCDIMIQAGLLDGKLLRKGLNTPSWILNRTVQVYDLTWEGHNFLDSIREETVWKKIKKEIGDKSGQVSFEILKDLAISASRSFLSQ